MIDRTRALSLPPVEHLPKPVAKAAAEHVALVAREQSAATALLALENARRSAVDADRDAYAAALRAGKADPGTPKTVEYDAEIVKAHRLVEGLTTAVASSTDEVLAAVARARPTWQADTARAEVEARTRYLEAIDALDRARTCLVEARSVGAWLEGPADSRYKTWSPPVRGLPAPHGGPTNFGDVIAALTADLPAAPAPTAAPALPVVDETQASPADLLGTPGPSTFVSL